MSESKQESPLLGYYRLHAPIYDATRWTFLGGRKLLTKKVVDHAASLKTPRILELGCGTGWLLAKCAKELPQAHFFGIDLSDEMIKRAHKRLEFTPNVHLLHQSILSHQPDEKYDLIYASYAVTMMHDIKKPLFEALAKLLKVNGRLMIVDFYQSPFDGFKSWMKLNHVDFIESPSSWMQNTFSIERVQENRMYGGLWSYALIEATPKK